MFREPIDMTNLCNSKGGKENLVVYDILRAIPPPASLSIRITEMAYPCNAVITGADIENMIVNFPHALSSIAAAMKMDQTQQLKQQMEAIAQ